VRDLTALHGMPLKRLNIQGCTVRDLTPLEGINLEEIQFQPTRITEGLEVLRRMENLKVICFQTAPKKPNIKFSAEEFWKRYNAGGFK
jgi:hypothetical protein